MLTRWCRSPASPDLMAPSILSQATAVTDRWGATHCGSRSALLTAPATIAGAIASFAGAASFLRPARSCIGNRRRPCGRHAIASVILDAVLIAMLIKGRRSGGLGPSPRITSRACVVRAR